MVSPAVVDELKRIVADSGVTKEDDEKVCLLLLCTSSIVVDLRVGSYSRFMTRLLSHLISRLCFLA